MKKQKQILQRIAEAEARAESRGITRILRLVQSMTTDELKEISDEGTTEERIDEIVKQAEGRAINESNHT